MPKKNNPGCNCCQDPFCCDGTIASSYTVTVESVAGVATNNTCPDTSCSNFWNNGPSGITLPRLGTSCQWFLQEFVDPICSNPAYGCWPDMVRSWSLRVVETGGNYYTRLEMRVDIFTPVPGLLHEPQRIVAEFDHGATQPVCGDVAQVLTRTVTDSCCDWSASTITVS